MNEPANPSRRLAPPPLLTRRPTWHPLISLAIILLVTGGIGLSDFMSGPNVSYRAIYYIPIALSVVWLGWRPAVVVMLLCLGVWSGTDRMGTPAEVGMPSALWNGAIFVISSVALLLLLHQLISLQTEMARHVRERTLSLEKSLQAEERLQQELLQVAARERNVLGHDLHDGLGQHLTATAMAMQILTDTLEARRDPHASHARRVLALIQDAIQQCRTLARSLLPSPVEPSELLAHLAELARTTARDHGVPVHFRNVGAKIFPPDKQAAESLFRIAQEAVRNAVKHARASKIDVILAGDREGWRLEIVDDGNGIPDNAGAKGGLGLALMQQRAAALKGYVLTERISPRGTRVAVTLPPEAVNT